MSQKNQARQIPLQIRRYANEDIPFIYSSWLQSYFHFLTSTSAISTEWINYFEEKSFSNKDLPPPKERIFEVDFQHLLKKDIFFRSHHELIRNIVPNAKIFVCCPHDDQEQICGYIVLSIGMDCLHYLYVKHPFRGLGIANRLLESALDPFTNLSKIKTYSHLTDSSYKLAKKYGWTFNPYSFYGVDYNAIRTISYQEGLQNQRI